MVQIIASKPLSTNKGYIFIYIASFKVVQLVFEHMEDTVFSNLCSAAGSASLFHVFATVYLLNVEHLKDAGRIRTEIFRLNSVVCDKNTGKPIYEKKKVSTGHSEGFRLPTK